MSQPTPRRLTLVSLLAIAGFGLSVYLTQHFYEIRSGTAAFKSFCNLGDAMNCDVVSGSRWAELFFGIPLSSAAAGWYVAILIVSLLARSGAWRRRGTQALMALSAWAFVMSAAYLAVMIVRLNTFCLFCLGVDAINVGLFALAWSIYPRDSAAGATGAAAKNQREQARGQWRTFAAVTGASVGVTVPLLGLLLSQFGMGTAPVQELVESALNSPDMPVTITDDLPYLGPKDAPVTFVEFSDFQCPHCKRGAMILNSVLNMHAGKVRIVFRNFPLDSKCNRRMEGRGGHAYACEAARAAVCANAQGQEKFKLVYEGLFEEQESLREGKPAELARRHGLDMAAFDACMASQATKDAVNRDIEEGIRLEIRSTPTIFFNGKRAEGAYPVDVWGVVIGKILASSNK